jgi:uncharacterized protein (DUF4213/DUF364 family)
MLPRQAAVTFLNNKKTFVFVIQTKFVLYEIEPKFNYKLDEVYSSTLDTLGMWDIIIIIIII